MNIPQRCGEYLDHVRCMRERNALLVFAFHGLFEDRREIEANIVDPLQAITVQQFRQFVAYYRECGYAFISPPDILQGLDPRGRYVLITFDDGYYSNSRVLPVLNEFGVSATFCISTNNVLQQKSFWWDVVYRQRMRQGVMPLRIVCEQNALKRISFRVRDRYLVRTFGKEAFKLIGDVDRPFTASELRQFSRERFVVLGNHTADHAILTNLSVQEAKDQIQRCQNALSEICGEPPIAIAFPNGNFSREHMELAREAGLTIGFSVVPGKNYLPLKAEQNGFICLNRLMLWGNGNIITQCKRSRSDIAIYNRIKRMLKHKTY